MYEKIIITIYESSLFQFYLNSEIFKNWYYIALFVFSVGIILHLLLNRQSSQKFNFTTHIKSILRNKKRDNENPGRLKAISNKYNITENITHLNK